MKNRLLAALCLFITMPILAQQVHIIPQPQQLLVEKGQFLLSSQTPIQRKGPGMETTVAFLNEYLQQMLGFTLKTNGSKMAAKTIFLEHVPAKSTIEGAYQLTVNSKGVHIKAGDEAGIFYGVQSLIQLIPLKKGTPLNLPFLTIKDEPRFAYRGLHLDVARHYMPVSFIKKFIDYIALFKLNTFHWHLTEDQGWRLEIKKYPKLTEVGAWRNGTIIGRYPGKANDNKPHGGFYTQNEVRELVKYAADRQITIIPEIELPGHASAAIAAYPFLSCFPNEKTHIPGPMSTASEQQLANGRIKLVQETWGVFDDVFVPSEETFHFLENVLDEVLELFPSKYIHIGGDECPKANWKRSAFCQELIKEKGLKDEHGLQSYFIGRMEKYLNQKGRQIIGWDEILEGGLAPNATVMSWRGEEGGIEAAKQNHTVIMTPGSHVYFDHTQTKHEDSVVIGGYSPIEKVYSYEPIPEAIRGTDKAAFVLGAQANLWTEYMQNPSKVEYMLFPRMGALSEVLWTMPEQKSWVRFEAGMPAFFNRLENWKINYSKAYLHMEEKVMKPKAGPSPVEWQLNSKYKNAVIEIKQPGKAAIKLGQSANLPIQQSGTYTANLYTPKSGAKPGAVQTINQNFNLNKATGKDFQVTLAPNKSYPGNQGVFGLVNGLKSTNGLVSAEWCGWSAGNFEGVLDLGNETDLNRVVFHTYQSKGSWIYYPKSFTVSLSTDGVNYAPAITKTGIDNEKESSATIQLQTSSKARYLKLSATSHGLIGDGQPGAGHQAWLFLQEIEVH